MPEAQVLTYHPGLKKVLLLRLYAALAVAVIRAVTISIMVLGLLRAAAGVDCAVYQPGVGQGTALCHCHCADVVGLHHIRVTDAGGESALPANADFLAATAGCAWRTLHVLNDLDSNRGSLPAPCAAQQQNKRVVSGPKKHSHQAKQHHSATKALDNGRCGKQRQNMSPGALFTTARQGTFQLDMQHVRAEAAVCITSHLCTPCRRNLCPTVVQSLAPSAQQCQTWPSATK
jgi:hypothetical protein